MRPRSPDMDAWIAEAASADIAAIARARGWIKNKGIDVSGPCPACGGTDRFSVNSKKKVFNCRGSVGGGVIRMLQHAGGLTFIEACRELTGRDPPDGHETNDTRDPEAMRERKSERREDRIRMELDEKHERADNIEAATELFRRGQPILGTWADKYLRARGVYLDASLASELRFIATLAYRGFADDKTKVETRLGSFPAMLAPIRCDDGSIIGCHRTYLDPERPAKLRPPGDVTRNKAKKHIGRKKHGAIWITEPQENMAIGEGIETVLSWHALGIGPDQIGLCTSVDLYNLAGKCTGTVSHPVSGKPVTNGVPLFEDGGEGVIMPSIVKNIWILGDGDSEPVLTRNCIRSAGLRWKEQGRSVNISMAPDGLDWSDVLMRRNGLEAA